MIRRYLFVLLCVGSGCLASQALEVTGFNTPRHGLVTHVDSNIRIDFDRPLDPATVDPFSVSLFGRWTGPVDASISLVNGNQSIVLDPSRDFTAGDLVTVSLSNQLMGADSSSIQTGGFAHQFWTRTRRVSNIAYTETATMTTGNPSRPYGGVATDLNDDGWLDITSVNEDSADLRVFMNKADGTGTFEPYTEPTFAIGNRASPSEAADFNRDGKTDITTANINDGTISVVLGNGDGTFMPQQTINVGSQPRGIAVLDIDGDGDSDIVNTNRASSNLSVHINNGNGVFGTPTTIDAGIASEWSLMSGDMNNDGLLDLVVGSGASGNMRVLTSNGNGTFTAQPIQPTAGRSWQVMLGDVNGDGNLDVSSVNAQANNGVLLLGNGDGTLQAASTYNVSVMGSGGNGFPLATDLGDIDGDGDLDWITSSFSGDWIVLENDGSGNFSYLMELDAPVAASCSLIHDSDNDGDMDLALFDEIDNVIIFSRNDGVHVQDGDFDADGDLDADDIDALTAAMAGGDDPALFDLNGDGNVDAVDQSQWLMLGGAANLASGLPYLMGDANLDGNVDTDDFDIWVANRFQSVPRWSRGDFTGDGAILVDDLHRWNENKFQSSLVSVPEPTGISFALFCLLFSFRAFLRSCHPWQR